MRLIKGIHLVKIHASYPQMFLFVKDESWRTSECWKMAMMSPFPFHWSPVSVPNVIHYSLDTVYELVLSVGSAFSTVYCCCVQWKNLIVKMGWFYCPEV